MIKVQILRAHDVYVMNKVTDTEVAAGTPYTEITLEDWKDYEDFVRQHYSWQSVMKQWSRGRSNVRV